MNNARKFERNAGALALAGAALWAATWTGSAVLADNHAAVPAATRAVVSLAFVAPLGALPALGGVWLLRHRLQRVQAGAGLVAASGLVVTASVPALLARVFALPAAWQLLGMAGVLVIALAGGFAAAALLRTPSVQWRLPFSSRAGAAARVALLASSTAVAITLQPPLREAFGLTFRHGLRAGISQLQGLPPSMQALIVVGFVAVAVTGLGAAALHPPHVAAAAGTAIAAYATIDIVLAVAAGQYSAWWWSHTAAVAVLTVSLGAVAARPQPVPIPGAKLAHALADAPHAIPSFEAEPTA